jgi:cyanophycin synthetase
MTQQGIKPRTVPERGRVFRVGHDNQGHAIDVTGMIHRSLREALNRVGHLFAVPVLGVDLIVRDLSAPLDFVHDAIIEVNPAPGFAQHERTHQGRQRNLAGLILDHLFPAGAGDARIPSVAGAIGCGAELEGMGRSLHRRGVRPAGYTRGAAWSGTPREKVGDGAQSASLLPLDARAEVLLIEVDEVMAGESRHLTNLSDPLRSLSAVQKRMR